MEEKLQIRVPKPCHKDWNKMSPAQQGNFCKSCSRLVYDFTGMTDDELRKFFLEKRDEKICGRFKTGQLASPEKITVPLHKIPAGLSAAKAFGLALFLVFGTGLFFCTSSSGATINELKISADLKRKEVSAEKTEFENGRHYFMGGSVASPGLQFPPQVYFPGGPGSILSTGRFDFSKENPDSLFRTENITAAGQEPLTVRFLPPDSAVNIPFVWGHFPDPDPAPVIPSTITGYSITITVDSSEDSVKRVPVETAAVKSNDSLVPTVIEETINTDQPVVFPVTVKDTFQEKEEIISGGNEDDSVSAERMPAGGPSFFEMEVYPNPTDGPYNIRYTLNTTADITIRITDLNGNLVKELVRRNEAFSGTYIISDDLSSLAGGIYFCKMTAGDKQLVQKLILSR